jgi:hypothetical protein
VWAALPPYRLRPRPRFRHERALEPASRRRIHAIRPSHVIELSRPPKTHSTAPSTLPAVICAGLDQVPLEGSEAGQYLVESPISAISGVRPW